MAADGSLERELLEKYRSELADAQAELVWAQDKVSRYELAVRGLEAVLEPDEPGAEPENVPAAFPSDPLDAAIERAQAELEQLRRLIVDDLPSNENENQIEIERTPAAEEPNDE
jgi:hypothetical protein